MKKVLDPRLSIELAGLAKKIHDDNLTTLVGFTCLAQEVHHRYRVGLEFSVTESTVNVQTLTVEAASTEVEAQVIDIIRLAVGQPTAESTLYRVLCLASEAHFFIFSLRFNLVDTLGVTLELYPMWERRKHSWTWVIRPPVGTNRELTIVEQDIAVDLLESILSGTITPAT